MLEFTVGDWQIKPQAGYFEQQGQCVHVEPKVMDVLVRLFKSKNQVVTRGALLDSVWGDVVVGEEALTRCISELRTHLGDTGRIRRYIKTIPKRGYALMAEEPHRPQRQLSSPVSLASIKRFSWLGGAILFAAATSFLYDINAPSELATPLPQDESNIITFHSEDKVARISPINKSLSPTLNITIPANVDKKTQQNPTHPLRGSLTVDGDSLVIKIELEATDFSRPNSS